MLILLPPSETKRDRRSPAPARPRPPRAARRSRRSARRVVDALDRAVGRRGGGGARAQARRHAARRDRRQRRAAHRVRRWRRSTATPGVLYDALGAASLPPAARAWLGRHVLIHSAPFGPVGGPRPHPGLPARRGGVASRPAAADAACGRMPSPRRFAASSPSFVLDLRSEAYVALGPIPARRGRRSTCAWSRMPTAERSAR